MPQPDSANHGIGKLGFAPVAIAVLLLIATVYWPLMHAGIVADDKIWFYKQAWLRDGDAWQRFMLHGFYQWTNYFRPLVVALFTFETRFFQGAPELMHAVSLGIHLTNSLLVGLLARRMCAPADSLVSRTTSGVAMALFGLHPALVEPVAWVSCQFDVVVNLFILMGLLMHLTVTGPALRAAGVAGCFFLAACAKESAVSMPILLALADVTRHSRDGKCLTLATTLAACWRRQKATYLAVLCAGLAYLALRYWALGFLTSPTTSEHLGVLQRFQTVCFVYTHYLCIIIWPMFGSSPIHIVDASQFAKLSFGSVAADVMATVIVAAAGYLAFRRKVPGIMVLAVTIALFPALHVIPVTFDPSLYHERYTMLAIALICVWSPGLLRDPAARFAPNGLAMALPVVLAAWLIGAILKIVATLPLWSDDALLWQWVMKEQPGLVEPKAYLLSTYIERNDPRAQALADRLVAENPECGNCMLNAAYLALFNDDATRAEAALKRLQQSPDLGFDKALYSGYVLATGELLEMQHDLVESEQAYRAAVALEPQDPQPAMQLALLLAREHRTSEAREAANRAIALFPPYERSQRQDNFEQVLAHSISAENPP